jgi:hypothetical protein
LSKRSDASSKTWAGGAGLCARFFSTRGAGEGVGAGSGFWAPAVIAPSEIAMPIKVLLIIRPLIPLIEL